MVCCNKRHYICHTEHYGPCCHAAHHQSQQVVLQGCWGQIGGFVDTSSTEDRSTGITSPIREYNQNLCCCKLFQENVEKEIVGRGAVSSFVCKSQHKEATRMQYTVFWNVCTKLNIYTVKKCTGGAV